MSSSWVCLSFQFASILLILQLLRRLQVSKLPSFNLPCKANHFYVFQSFICFKFQVISGIFVFIHGYIFHRAGSAVVRCLQQAPTPLLLQIVSASTRIKSMNSFYCTPDCLSNHARICQVTFHFVAHQRERITCPIYDGRYSVLCEFKKRTQSQIYSLDQNIRAERRRTPTVAEAHEITPNTWKLWTTWTDYAA